MRESAPSDASLACPICARLFTQAVKTPRDGTTFCEECIQTHLLEHDFTCPPSTAAEGEGAEGPEKIGSLDKLEEDWDARARVDAYIAKEIERRKYDTDAEATEDAADGVRFPPFPAPRLRVDKRLVLTFWPLCASASPRHRPTRRRRPRRLRQRVQRPAGRRPASPSRKRRRPSASRQRTRAC